MNELSKTLGFVVVGAAAAVIAFFSRPSLPVLEESGTRMHVLFPEFKDPLAAASLEIVDYDESTASIEPFKVAMVNNRWSIPSHDNYPTDAKDQLSKVAASLIGLKVLEVASDSPGDHGLYGVLDPDPKSLKAGATGVGTRVIMRDKNDKVLVNLIVGKAVPGRDGLHYVRVAGQDPVYTVALKTDKLTTKFSDWIETDLLKLNAWDIKQIQIHDYSIDELAGRPLPRAQLTIAYNDTGDPRWKFTEDKVFKNQQWVDGKLGDDEELNSTVLDDMKNALDDLKIVDVTRKPAGLSANLRATGTFYSDRETVSSLAAKGFYVARMQDYYELLSNDGEVRVLMKDGVQYVLRFGQIAGTGGEGKTKGKTDKQAKKDEKPKEESSSQGVNRYLFVMAEFNPEAIPKPELQPLPEEKPEEKPAEKAPAGKNPEDKTPGDKAAPSKPEEKKPEQKAKTDLKAERERIEKENKRKQEEYEQKIKDGEKRVKELNDRFADWYYVIADSVYQKIHLNREKIVKKKEKKEEGKKDEAAAKDHADHDHAAEAKKETPPETKKDAGAEQKKEAEPKQDNPAAPGSPQPKEPAPSAKPAT